MKFWASLIVPIILVIAATIGAWRKGQHAKIESEREALKRIAEKEPE